MYGGDGVVATASFMPVAGAYSAGDIVGIPKEFIFYNRDNKMVPPGSLIRVLSTVLKIDQTALISGEGAYTLQLYSVTPPSAQADNAAWSLASGDLPSYRGSISLGTPVDNGSACYVKSQYIDADLNLADEKSSLFGGLVTVGALTLPAVARQVFLYGILI